MRHLFIVLMVFFNFLLVAPVFADTIEGEQNPSPITLPNPLSPANDVWELINNIIAALRVYIAPPIVGLMVIYGAFQILTAGGEPEKFATGKKTILYAVIGYAIIFIASGISLIIKDVLR